MEESILVVGRMANSMERGIMFQMMAKVEEENGLMGRGLSGMMVTQEAVQVIVQSEMKVRV